MILNPTARFLLNATCIQNHMRRYKKPLAASIQLAFAQLRSVGIPYSP